MKKLLVAALLLICATAFADTITLKSGMTNSQFKDLVSDLSMIVTPTIDSPAEPLGTTGFDIALEEQASNIDGSSSKWSNALSDHKGYVAASRVHVQKGLPFGVDLGASVTQGNNLDFTAITLEGKYAFLEGSAVTPAIVAKVAYTNVTSMDDIDMQTVLGGLYISKGILMLTPYAGVEDVYAIASENSDAVNLDKVYKNNVRGLVGLQVCPFPLFVINLEAAKTTDMTQVAAKLGIRF